jgi:hypothetical protein
MEWINPKYAHVVAERRQRQADAPAQPCRCASEPADASSVPCRVCNGSGVRSAGFRSFITT